MLGYIGTQFFTASVPAHPQIKFTNLSGMKSLSGIVEDPMQNG